MEAWGWRGGDWGCFAPPQPGDPINPWGVGGTAGSCPRPALSSPSCNPFQRGGLGGFRAGFESEMGCFQIILRQLCPLSLMQRGIKIDMKIIGGEEAPPPVGGPAPPPPPHQAPLFPASSPFCSHQGPISSPFLLALSSLLSYSTGERHSHCPAALLTISLSFQPRPIPKHPWARCWSCARPVPSLCFGQVLLMGFETEAVPVPCPVSGWHFCLVMPGLPWWNLHPLGLTERGFGVNLPHPGSLQQSSPPAPCSAATACPCPIPRRRSRGCGFNHFTHVYLYNSEESASSSHLPLPSAPHDISEQSRALQIDRVAQEGSETCWGCHLRMGSIWHHGCLFPVRGAAAGGRFAPAPVSREH